MVFEFLNLFKKVSDSNKIHDDDFSDRLNRLFTVAVLIISCSLIGSSHLVSDPIACWTPAHFTGPMIQYTNHICWIANTYFVPTDETLPKPNEPREYQINYYQWVPFILAFMALLFYTPYIIWRFEAKPCGFDTKALMKIIQSINLESVESCDKGVENAVKLIEKTIHYNRDYSYQTCLGKFRRSLSRCFLPNNRSGCYISALYMLTKILYLANVCGQFFLLNAFMGPRFNIYGFEVIRDLINGKDFWESPRFPRVTMCDFTIRTLGENNQKHTIQCTLPINLFNEKIFIFIWFWLCLVAAFTAYSFFLWLFSFTSSSRYSFVKRYIQVKNRLDNTISDPKSNDFNLIESFLFEYLKQDGVFLLRMIKKNTNDILVGELVNELWINFKRYPRFKQNVEFVIEKEKYQNSL